MTYRELVDQLLRLPPERLDDTVTVYEPYEDEYIAVVDGCVATELAHVSVTKFQLDDEDPHLGHFYLDGILY